MRGKAVGTVSRRTISGKHFTRNMTGKFIIYDVVGTMTARSLQRSAFSSGKEKAPASCMSRADAPDRTACIARPKAATGHAVGAYGIDLVAQFMDAAVSGIGLVMTRIDVNCSDKIAKRPINSLASISHGPSMANPSTGACVAPRMASPTDVAPRALILWH